MPKVPNYLNIVSQVLTAFRTPHDQRSLKQKLVLTSAYSTVEFGTRIILRLVSTIILSRLLEPSIFGVFAVIGLISMMINTFTDVGLRPIALSREGGLSHRFIQSLQTARLIRGGLLMLIMGVVCGVVYALQQREYFNAESAFTDPELPFLMIGISVTFVVDALGTSNRALYDRELNHDLLFKYSMTFSVINGTLPFLMVYFTGSIWGLVIASIAISMLAAAVSWVVFKGAPFKLHLIKEDLLLFFHRGKWIMSQTMLTTFGSTADRILFGLMFTDARFGIYYLATQISQVFEKLLSGFENKVGIQLFNDLSDGSVAAFRDKYYRLRLPYDFVALSTAGFLAAAAPTLIDIIYEDRYSEVADFIQVLAFASIFTGPCLIRQAFMAQREFKLTSTMMLVRVILFWCSLSVAIIVFESVTLALWMVVMQRLPEMVMMLYLAKKRGWISYWREIRMLPCLALGWACGEIASLTYYWLLAQVFA